MAVKMHLLTGEVLAGGAHKTNCGKVGWEECGNEFTGWDNRRFDATAVMRKVTCKTCLRTVGSALEQRGNDNGK